MPVVAEDSNVRVIQLDVGEGMFSNAYLLVCRQTNDSVIIDAPGDSGKIMQQLEGTNPRYILITHNHWDHLGALTGVKSALKVPVGVHPLDAAGLTLSPNIMLYDNDTVSFGKVELKVIHTAGHTPGGLCFLTGKILISGDTIFPAGPGATRTPEAFRQIVKSIEEKIFVLPDDVKVFPGHGDSTVLKKEKEEYAIFFAKSHPPDLCGNVLWLSS